MVWLIWMKGRIDPCGAAQLIRRGVSNHLFSVFESWAGVINGELFFATARSSDQDAMLVLSPSLRDLGVKMNDVQRFTPFTIGMLWPSVARGVITRVQVAFTIKTKSDSERHRIPHQSRCKPRPPLIACATSSSTVSETDNSRMAMKEQRPFTGIGRSPSTR